MQTQFNINDVVLVDSNKTNRLIVAIDKSLEYYITVDIEYMITPILTEAKFMLCKNNELKDVLEPNDISEKDFNIIYKSIEKLVSSFTQKNKRMLKFDIISKYELLRYFNVQEYSKYLTQIKEISTDDERIDESLPLIDFKRLERFTLFMGNKPVIHDIHNLFCVDRIDKKVYLVKRRRHCCYDEVIKELGGTIKEIS